MITSFTHHDGKTKRVDVPSDLPQVGDRAVVWVDIEAPASEDSSRLLRQFGFHELAVEDAVGELQYPKIENYDGYLYLVLHGIDYQASATAHFGTNDVDFFLGHDYLVTLHGAGARTFHHLLDIVTRNDRILGEGAASLLHRIVDGMVDHYEPEIDKLEEALDEVEKEVFSHPGRDIVRRILDLKRDVGALRRVIIPQRDVVGRLSRREFQAIDSELAYRFRDVHDHLVRYSDEALIFQDRITALLEAHLSNVSNRLNEVMKVLTIIATLFMPLGVLTGFYGMNVPLPSFPGGGHAQSWWIIGVMLGSSAVMLWWFRKRHWL